MVGVLHASLHPMRGALAFARVISRTLNFDRSMRLKKQLCIGIVLLPMLSALHAQGANNPAPMAPSAIATRQSANSQTHPELSLSQVSENLKLRETQRPYWLAYVSRIDDYVKLYYQERPASAYASEPATRQIGRVLDQLQNRLAALEEVEGVAKALYAVLDPDQRKLADQVLISTIPVVGSNADASCPAPPEGKGKSDKNEGSQHKRRGGGMGGLGGMGQ